jgi:hypothetical protein
MWRSSRARRVSTASLMSLTGASDRSGHQTTKSSGRPAHRCFGSDRRRRMEVGSYATTRAASSGLSRKLAARMCFAVSV